ncbi:MAG: polysaccharide biosynthesis/export family protein [Bacteroidota bacterium]
MKKYFFKVSLEMSINMSQYQKLLLIVACCPMGYSLLSYDQALAYEDFQISEIAQLPEITSVESAKTSQPQFNQDNANEYVLGPGDEISVAVTGYPEFDSTHRILPDGTIAIPLIGNVRASGETLSSLSRFLREQLGSNYLVNPVIDLSLLRLRPVSVTISGEVHRPGPLQLDSVQANGNGPTLVDALIEAGGVTNFANISEVLVRRTHGNDRTETIALNFWDSLVSEPTAINLMLRDGDAVIVPRLSSEQNLDQSLIARSSIAPSVVQVKVVGEVTRPGEVEVSPASSLSSAIATAGGPTEDANLKEVAFIRVSENGQDINSEILDLRNLTDSFQVQAGDVIVVPKTGVASSLDFIGSLLNPFRIFTDIFRLIN